MAELGFDDFRVRIISGCARIQMPEAQLPLLMEKRGEVVAALKTIFPAVLLDMEPRQAST